MPKKESFFPSILNQKIAENGKSLFKTAASGTLLLMATSAFVYDISLQMGLLGGEIPSPVIALSLVASALALLSPQVLPSANQSLKP